MTTNNQNPSEYQLGWMEKIAPHHINSTLGRLITPSEMENLRNAMSKFGVFMNCCNLFEISKKNFQLLLTYHNELSNAYKMTNRQHANDFIEMSVQEINRLLLNYLSSFRTYLDHLNTRYSRLQKNGYPCLNDFKKITSVCYDTSFYYRFFYKLRNYVQHCGLPISYMSISEQPDNGSIQILVSTGFSRNVLLDESNDFNWGTVKKDLILQPEHIELLPCLNGFNLELKNIYLVVSSIEIAIANDSCIKFNEIFNEVKKLCPNGEPIIGHLIKLQNGKSEMKIINFPFHQIKKYYDLRLEVQNIIWSRKTPS
jgi:hypothetical protein